MVDLNSGNIDVPPNMTSWPSFHNGVAAGLKIAPASQVSLKPELHHLLVTSRSQFCTPAAEHTLVSTVRTKQDFAEHLDVHNIFLL